MSDGSQWQLEEEKQLIIFAFITPGSNKMISSMFYPAVISMLFQVNIIMTIGFINPSV